MESNNKKADPASLTSSNNEFKPDKVITISIAHLIHDIYSSFLASLLPLLIDKFGISHPASYYASDKEKKVNS